MPHGLAALACARSTYFLPAAPLHLTSSSARLPGDRKAWSTLRGICIGKTGSAEAGSSLDCLGKRGQLCMGKSRHGGQISSWVLLLARVGLGAAAGRCCGGRTSAQPARCGTTANWLTVVALQVCCRSTARDTCLHEVHAICGQQQQLAGCGLAAGRVHDGQRGKALDGGPGQAPPLVPPCLQGPGQRLHSS